MLNIVTKAPDLEFVRSLPPDQRKLALAEINSELESLDAQQRVAWALEHLPNEFALTSSFGIQSAVLLHMLTEQLPDIPVILTDTGYLFDETYSFIDDMSKRLKLNLKVYRSKLSPAWQEARMGKMWEQGVDGIKNYNRLNKVEPMQRALNELDIASWFSGLRRSQSDTRSELSVLSMQDGRFKVLPIVDWSNKDVHYYLQQHDLPYHPLWEQGYVSVGDKHTSRPMELGMSEQDTRFFGLTRECGIHQENEGSGI